MGKPTPTRIDAVAFGYLTALFSNPEFVSRLLAVDDATDHIECRLAPREVTEFHKYPHVEDYQKRLAVEFWPQRKQTA
jgi:hypothetical protein